MPPNRSVDLARIMLKVLALGALISTSFWIVRPFMVALICATTVAIATWPLLLRMQSWLGGRRARGSVDDRRLAVDAGGAALFCGLRDSGQP